MKPLEILKAARELIANPANWTTGVFAKDKDGVPCIATEEFACRFCALGAVQHASGAENLYEDTVGREVIDSLETYCRDGVDGCEQYPANVVYVNDSVGHEAVIKMFDAVIAQYQTRPAA